LNKETVSYTEQPVAAPAPEQEDPLIVFFGIGVVINLVMITAYFIWAYKQWNKSDKPDR
jgi:heme/copper-type cytochrome/quinol oxidase subunit 2